MLNRVEDNPTVVIAYLGDDAVGCGCFEPLDRRTVEIKRMFVAPAHRGRGGRTLPEAIRLYERSGYVVIENYGPFVGMPESVCMAKDPINPARE